MPTKKTYPKNRLIMAVIADEATVTGFLLTGMGQRDMSGAANYFMSSKETTDDELAKVFEGYTAQSTKIGIIFIAQNLAERIRDKIIDHQENEETLLPIVMEIPSKESEYDPTKDTMLVQAATRLFGGEAGLQQLVDDGPAK